LAELPFAVIFHERTARAEDLLEIVKLDSQVVDDLVDESGNISPEGDLLDLNCTPFVQGVENLEYLADKLLVLLEQGRSQDRVLHALIDALNQGFAVVAEHLKQARGLRVFAIAVSKELVEH